MRGREGNIACGMVLNLQIYRAFSSLVESSIVLPQIKMAIIGLK